LQFVSTSGYVARRAAARAASSNAGCPLELARVTLVAAPAPFTCTRVNVLNFDPTAMFFIDSGNAGSMSVYEFGRTYPGRKRTRVICGTLHDDACCPLHPAGYIGTMREAVLASGVSTGNAVRMVVVTGMQS
jgi:hypothetical protein